MKASAEEEEPPPPGEEPKLEEHHKDPSPLDLTVSLCPLPRRQPVPDLADASHPWHRRMRRAIRRC
jgi:hypothetical protein